MLRPRLSVGLVLGAILLATSAASPAHAQGVVEAANTLVKAGQRGSRIAELCETAKLSQAGKLAAVLEEIQAGGNLPRYKPQTTARAYARLIGANEQGLLDGSPSLRLLAGHVTRSTIAAGGSEGLNVLVIDIGGGNFHTHMRTADGRELFVDIPSGRQATPQTLLDGLARLTADWPEADVISVGYNGAVRNNAPALDPVNLGSGWQGFDFANALGKPTLVVNDAAMQALGGHTGGRSFYYGLGTGLGTTLVLPSGRVIPLEFGHMPSGVDGKTFEELVGHHHFHHMDPANGPELTRRVARQLPLLMQVFKADKAQVGGGAQVLVDFSQVPVEPERLEVGDNDYAFDGGVKLWNALPTPDIGVARAQRELIDALTCQSLSCMHAKAIAADLAGQEAIAAQNAGHHPALQYYDGGTMLYWPADGKGAAIVVGGEVADIDLSILPYDAHTTFGQLADGRDLEPALALLKRGFNADEIVLGEGWGPDRPAGTKVVP